jgi:hypothetical protein
MLGLFPVLLTVKVQFMPQAGELIIDKNKYRKLGWRVQTKFQLGMHLRDLSLILQVQTFFLEVLVQYI